MMTTTAEIRTALLDAFDNELGTYTFAGGLTTPAIRVDDGMLDWAEEPTPTGLEIVILESPEVAMTPMLGGWQDTYTWAIFLKQWDLEATTLPYREKLVDTMMGFESLQVGNLRRIMRQTKLDNIETMSVQVSEAIWVEA